MPFDSSGFMISGRGRRPIIPIANTVHAQTSGTGPASHEAVKEREKKNSKNNIANILCA